MNFARHFESCNHRDLTKFVPFAIGLQRYGWVTHELKEILLREHADDFAPHGSGVTLADRHDNFIKRSAALAGATTTIAARRGMALRREMYPVIRAWGENPIAEIDRVAVPWFGIHGFGVHANGFVRRADGPHIWIGVRAANRLVDPGKLDNMIGGGQPIGLSLEDNLAKEAAEEAGIPASMARTARTAGNLTYLVERMQGLRHDTLFLYDLQLPENFIPSNTDGEVSSFTLMPAHEIAEIVRTTDRFKFNCNLVMIDFLMRHGYFTASHAEHETLSRLLDETRTRSFA